MLDQLHEAQELGLPPDYVGFVRRLLRLPDDIGRGVTIKLLARLASHG